MQYRIFSFIWIVNVEKIAISSEFGIAILGIELHDFYKLLAYK